ncbi:MAG: hypothetical protein ABI158_01690 [Edaphobacter sp.]
MTTGVAIANVLDETIEALCLLDANRLEILERRLAHLAQSRFVASQSEMDRLRAKRAVYKDILRHSASNLNALNRLYGRETRGPWEHSAR